MIETMDKSSRLLDINRSGECAVFERGDVPLNSGQLDCIVRRWALACKS